LGPKANLHVLWKRRISCPFQESNPRYFTIPSTLSHLLDIYINSSVGLHTYLFVSPHDLFEIFAVLIMLILGKFAYSFCSLLPYLIIHVDGEYFFLNMNFSVCLSTLSCSVNYRLISVPHADIHCLIYLVP
jgi:hypothetical protein